MITRPQGSPDRLREMAGALSAVAANVRGRASELEGAGAGVPAQWGWSGRAASAYSRSWQNWKGAVHAVADRMDSGRPGARQILVQLADELQAAQRQWDDAVSMAQAMGLAVDANGYVTPRSAPPPSAPAPGSPEEQVEAQLRAAWQGAQQAYASARDWLVHLFDKGWAEATDKIFVALGWPMTPVSVLSSAATVPAAVRYVQSVRGYPALAARMFDDTVAPAMEAYARGDGTLGDVLDAAWLGLDRAQIARVFTVDADRASFLSSGMRVGGFLDKVGTRVLLPLGIAADAWTIFHPPSNEGTTEQRINQVASGVNLVGSLAVGADMVGVGGGLLAADAALGWVPVAGQVLVVASALVLAGIWAYDNVPAFHDFCNSVGSETVHIAGEAWGAASQGASTVVRDVGSAIHTAANVEHTVTNTLSGAAHAVTGFFHWP